MTDDALSRWVAGWRGPALAALLALLAAAPAVFALPPLDRDESRFAQATTQMLETGDFTNINFQDQPRHKKPVGIHWLQAISVALTSDAEARAIWAYRLPSVLGAMLAAAACAWGARAFHAPGVSFAAGAILGISTLLSIEAGIAKTDAALCAAVTVAMAALGRFYAQAKGVESGSGGVTPARRTLAIFWTAVGASILIKGPVGPMVVALAMLALWAMDRHLGWARRMQWWWGLVVCLLLFGPWALAITVATDGAFWTGAIAGDLGPKLNSGDEGHSGPPGYHTLLLPILIFPATLLIPAAAVLAWRGRREPGVRFALAWALPTWLLFELLPTKLPHYTLPAWGGLAWLLGAALFAEKGRWVRLTGAALSAAVGLLFAALGLAAVSEYGDGSDANWAAAAAGLFAGAGIAGAAALVQRASRVALVAAGALAVTAHGVLLAGLAPRLEPLWLSARTSALLERTGLHPLDGSAPGPVEAAGFAEPSLVFALGSGTGLGGPEEAAEALAQGRPAVVAETELPAFQAAVASMDLQVRAVETLTGVNYSNGDPTRLTLFRPETPRP